MIVPCVGHRQMVLLALKTSDTDQFYQFTITTDFIYDTSQHLLNIVSFLTQQLAAVVPHTCTSFKGPG